ncbi:MAG: hypothetical protein HQL57_00870 [Magnetococcales bacterium]|nr:hypothetical protein [Magnetococcales bacterium]
MTQPAGSADDGFQNRITILEGLLRQVVEVHLSTAKHVRSLDRKLGEIEVAATSVSGLVRKMESLAGGVVPATAVKSEIPEEVKQGMEELRREVAQIQATLVKLLEKADAQPALATGPMVEQLDALSRVPDLIDKFGSQQSTLIRTLEKRIDPRLMIYLKPLIEMLEEEGRQAEKMKDAALAQLNELLEGKHSGTDQEISRHLQSVGREIEKCQAAFERTQQALQIVVTPFQNIGRLFRGNLETIVQAHDLMAQLHEDFPRFLDEMRKMHEAESGERSRQEAVAREGVTLGEGMVAHG